MVQQSLKTRLMVSLHKPACVNSSLIDSSLIWLSSLCYFRADQWPHVISEGCRLCRMCQLLMCMFVLVSERCCCLHVSGIMQSFCFQQSYCQQDQSAQKRGFWLVHLCLTLFSWKPLETTNMVSRETAPEQRRKMNLPDMRHSSVSWLLKLQWLSIEFVHCDDTNKGTNL